MTNLKMDPNSTINATCHRCHEVMEVQVKGSTMQHTTDVGYQLIVDLDATDIEAHMLMHDVCECDWMVVEGDDSPIVGFSHPNPQCPLHVQLDESS